MKHTFDRLVALAVGAAAMYYLDPQMGRRRRALLCDKFDALCHDACHAMQAKGKDAAHRVKGMVAQAGSSMASEPVDDERLAERIRSQLGRLVSTPGAVDVSVADGVATLSGQILAAEREPLVEAVAAMQGVGGVDDRLSTHDAPGNVPELQGAP
ncbi:BON domain-containing protein [Orrella sp. JC864]|uniref:BON domain-containing protein n=1 Tax=Orrella sp. JC864 TaxID=3120298 RepID=UPI003008241F